MTKKERFNCLGTYFWINIHAFADLQFEVFFSVFPSLQEKKQRSEEPKETIQVLCLRRRGRCVWDLQTLTGVVVLLFMADPTGTGWFIYLLWAITRSQSYSPACREMESGRRTRIPLERSFSRWDHGACASNSSSMQFCWKFITLLLPHLFKLETFPILLWVQFHWYFFLTTIHNRHTNWKME